MSNSSKIIDKEALRIWFEKQVQLCRLLVGFLRIFFCSDISSYCQYSPLHFSLLVLVDSKCLFHNIILLCILVHVKGVCFILRKFYTIFFCVSRIPSVSFPWFELNTIPCCDNGAKKTSRKRRNTKK